MGESAIEWTDATWNPITGCDKVSPGCKNCYAMALAARLKRMGQPRYQKDGTPPTSGPGFGVTLHEDKLNEPLHWRKPRMVFVNSMSDLFHEEVPSHFIAWVFAAMAKAPRHTFQILTKRPERMRDLLRDPSFWVAVRLSAVRDGSLKVGVPGARVETPLPNVWLGTSIEMRTYVGRADALRDTPAAVRFISAEPLLGPLVSWEGRGRGWYGLDLDAIDWLIVGGESGANHRPMDPEWARSLRDAADYMGTAFFFKQWGGRTPKSGGRELDGRIYGEMPRLAVAA